MLEEERDDVKRGKNDEEYNTIQYILVIERIQFIQHIAKILANRLSHVISSVVSEVQTAYIKGRQIIDGPLMVNEIISWATKKNKNLFVFKVDFEKAFDSLDWNFLDSIMSQMGFGYTWRNWIKCCLNSTFGSVLVNGSPTLEFKNKERASSRRTTFYPSIHFGGVKP